jgi:hypothetical protein
MCLMLTIGCLYQWIKSKKPATNLFLIEVGIIEIKYTKLYTTIENVFYCANKTSWGKDFAISIEVYHMYLIRLMYVELSLVLANTRIHIVHHTYRTYLKIVCINVLYPMYSNRLGHVNKTLTHARLTDYPLPSANRKIPHAESLQTVYLYRQYVQASGLPQFASPPGGECTYYVCSCNYLTRIICNVAFHILSVSMEKIKKRNCSYSICVKPTLTLPVRNTNSATKSVLKRNVSHILVQIPVRYILSKMSEPGKESQPSIVMIAGEYLRFMCFALVICTLLNASEYIRNICITVATGAQIVWYRLSICRKHYLSPSSHSYKLAICLMSNRCDGSNRYGE